MLYKYVTENNLEAPQNYMYSDFGGKDFLFEYEKIRLNFVKKHANINQISIENFVNKEKDGDNAMLQRLKKIYFILKINGHLQEIKSEFEYFVKIFELRKRIFNKYEEGTYRPVLDSGYECYRMYILFSWLLSEFYERSDSLKYLNTFLKVNDTLLSRESALDDSERGLFSSLVKKEIEYIRTLAQSKIEKVQE